MRTCMCLALLPVWLVGCGMAGNPQQSVGPGVRPPMVAGQFYPAERGRLEAAVTVFLDEARPARGGTPVAIVAPHAGYVFSGQIAADAFAQARGERFERVVILGTNHRVAPFHGVALPPWAAFRTPLGDVAVDQETVQALRDAADFCRVNPAALVEEHSVEVQLPFVQFLFPAARVVPLVVGDADPEFCRQFGEVLGKVLAARPGLIVASSDLAHYPGYEDAVTVDHRLLDAVLTLDPQKVRATAEQEMGRHLRGLDTCACGQAPIMAAMTAATTLGATGARLVSYANSGDTLLGERGRVVGYGAVCIYRGEPGAAAERESAEAESGALDDADRTALLEFARKAIHRILTTDTAPLPRSLPPRTRQQRGAFVTLKKHGELRGCIGHITADAPLGWVVGSMAIQAAMNDPRFPPLRLEEFAGVEIEISVLTVPRPVGGAGEIVVGRDGVILNKNRHSAVFLPQVATEQGWDRDAMLDQLCRKAGLAAGEWRNGAEFLVFQAEVFGEHAAF